MKSLILLGSLLFSVHLIAETPSSISFDQLNELSAINSKDEVELVLFELSKIGVPVDFAKDALYVLRGVSFKKMPAEATGVYYPAKNWIYLPYTFKSAQTGKIKKLSELTNDQIATIFHELWHCYRTKVLRSRNPEMLSYWVKRSKVLYSNHNSSFHDEAWATFIDQSISNYVSFFKIMLQKDSDGRERLRNSERFTGIYERSINEKVFGYYRTRWGGKFIFSTVNLPMEDRLYILTNLLENRISYNFENDFSEDKF